MKRLAAGTVLGLMLALAPASLRAGDTFEGHYNYGDLHFIPRDAVAIKELNFERGTSVVFADFALDRQAILDSADPLLSIYAQAKAARGRSVTIYIDIDDRERCSLTDGLPDGPIGALVSTVKSDGRRVRGTCAGQYRRTPALDFSFTVDLPVNVLPPAAPIDPKTGEQAVVVRALMSALAASDWDTARRYLPTNLGPPYFATPEIKESFFRGVARNYPSQMVLDEGWVKGSSAEAFFTGTTVDGAPMQRSRVRLEKMDGTWRVLRPYAPGASLPWWWGSGRPLRSRPAHVSPLGVH